MDHESWKWYTDGVLTTHVSLRRLLGSYEETGTLPPIRRSRHPLGVFLLRVFLPLLFLSCVTAPSLQAPANAAADGVDGNGAVGEVGEEITAAVARAAALYREFKAREALAELENALTLAPDHPEALIWTARSHIDVGDLVPETVPEWEKKRVEQYRAAERYARAAVRINPESTWPHFFLAVALAKLADFSTIENQIAMAGEIRGEVDKAIALDPDNGFAYHILGVWHRRMAEINRTERLLARLFLLKSVPAGHLDDSVRYLEKALEHNPDVITHHLELAKTYHALGKTELARKHLVDVDALPVRFSDDGLHKRKARELLQELERNG